jgi:acyl-coenzyme A thioesterase 9
VLRTDGVFRELTAVRVAVPWIEAFQQREQANQRPEEAPKQDAEDPTETPPELVPKHMSDSYHSVILPLARDPWLSDTYLNASGHIRFVSRIVVV